MIPPFLRQNIFAVTLVALETMVATTTAGSPSRSFSLNSNQSGGGGAAGGRFVFPGLEWDDEFTGVYTGQWLRFPSR